MSKVGVAGGQITEPRAGFPYIFDNSQNGFSGRDPYIAFGDQSLTQYSDTENRSVTLPPLDLTSISKMTFDAIRGNGINGGSAPESVGDEFGVSIPLMVDKLSKKLVHEIRIQSKRYQALRLFLIIGMV